MLLAYLRTNGINCDLPHPGNNLPPLLYREAAQSLNVELLYLLILKLAEDSDVHALE